MNLAQLAFTGKQDDGTGCDAARTSGLDGARIDQAVWLFRDGLNRKRLRRRCRKTCGARSPKT